MNFKVTSQTISWFRNEYRNGNLTLKPRYQRKPVWVTRQKCYLIESILMQLPVPEIYIQKTTSPAGDMTYGIVDGQQRVRAILQFIGSENDPDEQEYNKFALDKLDPASPWFGKAFADLTESERQRFYGYDLAVRFLETNDGPRIRDMFQRLNRYLTALKPQELRNATYGGPFIQLAEQLANDDFWTEGRIITAAAIRRMGDIEFTSELLIGLMHGPQAGSPAAIDEYYKRYEDCEDEFPDQRRVQSLFAETLRTIRKVLPEIRGTRWANKTDFYSLFVAIAAILKTRDIGTDQYGPLRERLTSFASEVAARLGDESVEASPECVRYVRAVEKGANDKARRADRHAVLAEMVSPHFQISVGP